MVAGAQIVNLPPGTRLVIPTGNNPLQNAQGQSFGNIFPVDIPPGSAARFAKKRYQFSTIQIDLSVARNNEKLKITGNILWAVTATDTTATLNIKYNEQLGSGLDFRQGLVLSGADFDQLFITNAAQAGKTITLYYAVNDVANPVFFQNFSGSFSTVTITPGGTLTTNAVTNCPNATSTQVLASNGNRKTAIIFNPGPGTVFIQNAAGAAGAGTPLLANQTATLDYTGAVFIRNDTGAAINISANEIAT